MGIILNHPVHGTISLDKLEYQMGEKVNGISYVRLSTVQCLINKIKELAEANESLRQGRDAANERFYNNQECEE